VGLFTSAQAYDIYLFDAASGVQLNINKAAVTCHLGIAIYNQHHLAPIQQHYCLRLQWLGHSFDNIDWKHYAMTYKRFPDNVLFTANFDGRNSGGGKASQKKSWYDHPCPKCSQEHKEDNHLFQCKQVSQTQWRTMQIATLSENFTPFWLLIYWLLSALVFGLTCHAYNMASKETIGNFYFACRSTLKNVNPRRLLPT
jgi:hypothetical protein